MFCFRTAHTKKGQVVTVLIELYEFLPSFVSIERVTNILFPLTVGYVFFFLIHSIPFLLREISSSKRFFSMSTFFVFSTYMT